MRPGGSVTFVTGGAAVLGRDLRFEALTDDQAAAEMRGAVPDDFVEALFRLFTKGEFDDSSTESDFAHLIGRPPRTFEQWARAHAAAFASGD